MPVCDFFRYDLPTACKAIWQLYSTQSLLNKLYRLLYFFLFPLLTCARIIRGWTQHSRFFFLLRPGRDTSYRANMFFLPRFRLFWLLVLTNLRSRTGCTRKPLSNQNKSLWRSLMCWSIFVCPWLVSKLECRWFHLGSLHLTASSIDFWVSPHNRDPRRYLAAEACLQGQPLPSPGQLYLWAR